MSKRSCSTKTGKGADCRAAPIAGSDFCFMHDPSRSDEAAEARRLGGLRRRREKAVSGAYNFEGLTDVTQIRRLLEIAAVDTLGLENSVARSRTIAAIAQVALKALEVADFDERVKSLEAAMAHSPADRG